MHDALHLGLVLGQRDGFPRGRDGEQHVGRRQVVLDHFQLGHVDGSAAAAQGVHEGDLPGERRLRARGGRTAALDDRDVADVGQRVERRLQRRRAHVERNRVRRGLVAELQLERAARRHVLQALDFRTRLDAVLDGDDLDLPVADDLAVDQRAVRDRGVPVEALDEGVDVGDGGVVGVVDEAVAVVVDAVGEEGGLRRAGVDEDVEAIAAGDRVAPEATVEHVVERRSDELVVAGAPDEDECDLVRAPGPLLGIGLADAGGIEDVVPGLGIDGQTVTFRAHALVDDHFVVRRARAAGHAHLREEPGRILAGGAEDELIVDARAFDQHGVGGAVVELEGVGDLAVELLAVDVLYDHARPVHGEAVAEADGEAREPHAGEVAHDEGVGAAAPVDLQVLDPVDGQRDGHARIGRPCDDDVQLIGAAGGPLDLDEVPLVPAKEL